MPSPGFGSHAPPTAKVHLLKQNAKAGNTGTCVVLVPGGGHNVLGLGGCKAMVPFLHDLGVSKSTDGGVIQAPLIEVICRVWRLATDINLLDGMASEGLDHHPTTSSARCRRSSCGRGCGSTATI